MKSRLVTGVWVAILLILPTAARADEPQEGGATSPFNLTAPTMGGKQFWSDQLIFRGWRIQKNLVVGHYRLLDDKDARRAWGTFDVCQNKLQAFRDEDNLPPMEGEIVLVLHGLGRTRSSMAPLCKYLEQESKYTTLNMSYATTRGTLNNTTTTSSVRKLNRSHRRFRGGCSGMIQSSISSEVFGGSCQTLL